MSVSITHRFVSVVPNAAASTGWVRPLEWNDTHVVPVATNAQAAAGTDDTVLMTPAKTTVAIQTLVTGQRTVTAAGDITVSATDHYVIVNKTVGAATNANLPAAASYGGGKVTIKDGKGDADSNNISIVPNGTETIDGSNTALVISSAFGFYSLIAVTGGWLTV